MPVPSVRLMWEYNSLKIGVDVNVLRVVHESHVVSLGDDSEAATAAELYLSRVIPASPHIPLPGL